jgi:hypothetical protein
MLTIKPGEYLAILAEPETAEVSHGLGKQEEMWVYAIVDCKPEPPVCARLSVPLNEQAHVREITRKFGPYVCIYIGSAVPDPNRHDMVCGYITGICKAESGTHQVAR